MLFPSVQYLWIPLIIPILWLVRYYQRGYFFERTTLDMPIGLLGFIVLMNIVLKPHLERGLGKVMGILLGLFFFYAAGNILRTAKWIKSGAMVFLSGGFMLAFVGLFNLQWSNKLIFNVLQIDISHLIPHLNLSLPGADKGINPNPLSGTLILVLPLLLSFLMNIKEGVLPGEREQKKAIIPKFFVLLIMFLSMLLVIILCQSVNSWIGLLMSILILIRSSGKRIFYIVVLIGIFLGSILLLSEKTPALKEQLDREARLKIEGRVHLWQSGIKAIEQNPFIGIGINELRFSPDVTEKETHAHNHFIHTAAELGLPALIIYISILLSSAWMCLTVMRNASLSWMRIMARGLLAGQFAYFVFGIFDSIPLGAKPGIVFWASLALISALYNFQWAGKVEG